jgi:hypothetical protein
MDEKKALLLEEYKLCQESVQKIESSIWTTSGIIGIGTLGTLILALQQIIPKQILDNTGKSSELGAGFLFSAIIIGVATAAVWIWWGMAQRWWRIQHSTLRRIRHIEQDLGMYQKHYIDYRDYSLPKHAWHKMTTDLSAERLEDLRLDFKGIELDKLNQNYCKEQIDRLHIDRRYLRKMLCELEKKGCITGRRKKEFRAQVREANRRGVQGYLKWYRWIFLLVFASVVLLLLNKSGNINETFAWILFICICIGGVLGGMLSKTTG